MRKKYEETSKTVIALLLFALCSMTAVSFVQQAEKVSRDLMNELIGPYQLEVQGKKGVFLFIEEDGQLRGAPAGEKPSLLEPVEEEDLTFVGHSPDGTEHRYKFLRGEDGKIASCILSIPDAGLVIHMIKMED